MMDKYITDATGQPVQTDDWKVWAEFMASPARRIGFDVIGEGPQEVKVSTVFLGIDHAFHSNGPILWETMVFGGKHDQYQRRYMTLEAARAGHAKAVALVKEEPCNPSSES